MNKNFRTAVLLFFAVVSFAAGSNAAWACDVKDGGPGICLGTKKIAQDFHWSFSLINLTNSNIKIGTAPDHGFGGNFPYNTVFPPGNAANSKTSRYNSDVPSPTLGLTTWKSAAHNEMFPDHFIQTVPFEIQSDSGYNFTLQFSQNTNYAQQVVVVQFKPPYGASTWNYKTNVSNDNGYYAYPPRNPGDDYLNDTGYDGILFAISDKYVLSVFKNNAMDNDGNSLILVVTQRYPEHDYHGQNVRWLF